MSENTTTQQITCPQCGQPAAYSVIEEPFAFYTGEYEDDDWPAVETMVARGWIAECRHCGWCDGEAPHW